jgi:hypothetical protein
LHHPHKNGGCQPVVTDRRPARVHARATSRLPLTAYRVLRKASWLAGTESFLGRRLGERWLAVEAMVPGRPRCGPQVWPPGDGPDVVGNQAAEGRATSTPRKPDTTRPSSTSTTPPGAPAPRPQQHQHHASDANATNSNPATGSSTSDPQKVCGSIPAGSQDQGGAPPSRSARATVPRNGDLDGASTIRQAGSRGELFVVGLGRRAGGRPSRPGHPRGGRRSWPPSGPASASPAVAAHPQRPASARSAAGSSQRHATP